MYCIPWLYLPRMDCISKEWLHPKVVSPKFNGCISKVVSPKVYIPRMDCISKVVSPKARFYLQGCISQRWIVSPRLYLQGCISQGWIVSPRLYLQGCISEVRMVSEDESLNPWYYTYMRSWSDSFTSPRTR